MVSCKPLDENFASLGESEIPTNPLLEWKWPTFKFGNDVKVRVLSHGVAEQVY